MAIKCGHCKNYHPSTADVHECFALEQEALAEMEWERQAELSAMRYYEDRAATGGWFGYGD